MNDPLNQQVLNQVGDATNTIDTKTRRPADVMHHVVNVLLIGLAFTVLLVSHSQFAPDGHALRQQRGVLQSNAFTKAVEAEVLLPPEMLRDLDYLIESLERQQDGSLPSLAQRAAAAFLDANELDN